MNENVTNKTPKRRRWIARLLVSTLCILLASSLLFVSVVAENVNTFTVESVDQSVSDSKRFFGYHFSSNGNMGITEASVNPSSTQYIYIYKFGSADPASTVSISIPNISAFGGCSSGEDWIATWHFDGSVIVVNIWDYDGNIIDFDSYSVSSFESFYYSITGDYFCFYNGSSIITKIAYSDGSGTVHIKYLGDADASSLGFISLPLFYSSQWVFYVAGNVDGVAKGGILYSSSLTYSLDSAPLSLVSKFFVFSGSSIFGVFRVGNTVYSYSIVDGSYVSNTVSDIVLFKALSVLLFPFDSSSFSSTLVGYGISNNSNSYNTVYATSSEYVPPESSDDTTTEPPPESSEGSSADPSGATNIWGSILNADGSYTSTLLGTLDLSQATEVRAYIGSWTSKDSPFQSETPVPLTFYVYNSEDGPPDIYTFDYHAAGYSLLGDSVSDFMFPDVIGQFFTLPYNGETDLYFPNVAPYGTVLVSTPFGDSFGGRVMLNLVSADSYFRIDFVDEDTFAVVVFNGAGPGSRTNFDLDIRAYREGYRLEDGETSSSRWFYPSFSSSASYTAEYVIESGLYLIFVDSFDDTVYPWEDGTWSDVIGDANSRLEDVSANHALLESLANDAYGKYSFDPMTNQNFIGAVSEFNDIRDSSGGNYILHYFWGMWNIHPFASSMIAIVGTLAIVGFIIRKM